MAKINLNQIKLVDSSTNPALDGAIPVANTTSNHLWSTNNTSGILIPRGTSGQRPASPPEGFLRYNTTTDTFELFTSGTAWRELGQLANLGTASNPARSFIGDENTGSYSPAADEWAVSTGGVQRLLVTSSLVNVTGNFAASGTLSGTLLTETSNQLLKLATQESTLSNNVSIATAIGGNLTYSASMYEGVYVDYILRRNGEFQTGTLIVTTNGTTASIQETESSTASLGVTFSAAIASTNVEIRYTSTNTGFDIDAKFNVRRWGID